ncbi:MAG TPA: GntR family transcriptional regulator [Abditibacterium sp.]
MNTKSKTVKSQTKLQETCDSLSRLARQSGAGAKLPTVVQLRQTLGVGVNTLNDALTQLEDLHLITRRQGSGIYVSPTLRRTIALVCDPTIMHGAGISPVWQMLLSYAQKRAASEGETLEFHIANPWTQSEPFSSDLIRKLEDHHVNGIIGIGLIFEAVEHVERIGIPFVAYAGAGTYTVSGDASKALQLGYAELMARGCRRIAIWNSATPGRPAFGAKRQMERHRAAVEACGGTFQPELVWDAHCIMPSPTLSPQEQGFQVAKEIFGAPADKRPDGLYINDDMMTHGALIAFEQMNLKTGRDFHLATHANKGSGILQGRTSLILVEHDPAAIVEVLFDTIERLMDNCDVPIPQILIPPTLRIV